MSPCIPIPKRWIPRSVARAAFTGWPADEAREQVIVNKLAVIAVAGLGISAVCIGVRASVGGGLNGFGLESPDGRPKCSRIPTAAATSRTLAWDAGDSVRL